MHKVLVFWISIIYISVAYSANFPYDLIAESSDNAKAKVEDNTKNDDEKRTLSQQVAEGKYALIHKELFNKPIQRPGVISYSNNNEVPNDTSSNYGGLNKSDIWLAENHLLVIKGGFYPMLEPVPEYSKPEWSPIDDYEAPRRQVKLPKYPKVPPPFPVQLRDGGPLQILGTNRSRNINDTFFPPKYPISPVEGYEPGSGPFYPPEYTYPTNSSPGKAPLPGSPNPSPVPEHDERNRVKPGGSILPPFFEALPPGVAILPPPNITDDNDEDDLSIYYPPPYSFYYPTDNTTNVPPGPLVPGIVLPPPPDFFGPLHDPTTTTTTTTPKPTTKTKPTQKTKPGSVTILRPVKPKPPSQIYIYDNQIPHRPIEEDYGPPPPPPPQLIPPRRKIISTTKLPLVAYFATSDKTQFVKTKKPDKQFYYYEPGPETNTIPVQFPSFKNPYLNDSNSYVVKPHFYYLPTQGNNFKAHIVELEEQIRTYEQPPGQLQPNTYEKPVSKPVYQYSFEVSNYQEQHNKLQGNNRPKYSVQIEPAVEITTSTPEYYPHQYNYQTPRPVTANPVRNRGYFTTVNPLYNTHYTKQDEQLYDDITKTYFTTFGKRIKATTPIPYVSQYTVTKPRTNVESFEAVNVQNQHYNTYLNENVQKTNINPIQSIRIPNQYQRPVQNAYPNVQEINNENHQYITASPLGIQTYDTINIPTNQRYIPRQQQKGNAVNPYLHIIKPAIQTIDDVGVPTRQNNIVNSYIHSRKQPSIETVQTIRVEPDNKEGSYISYQLPGDDGAHFYFLTPQLAQQNVESQHIGYYYPQPDSSRIARHT